MSHSLQEELFDGYIIRCDVIPMGEDLLLAVCGGDTPHIGSVVMAFPRASLTGEGLSATSSVINGIGHKDEAVGRRFAEAVAVRTQRTAVCACGIHVDNITPEQIQVVQHAGERLLERVLESLGS